MKLQERTRETLDRLPELPEGIEVPDDVSGLTHPPAGRKVAGGIRWMRWLVALVVIAIGAGVATWYVTQGDGTDYVERATGSDRHLTTAAELTPAQVVVDYMDLYGTDNPTFPMVWVREQGSDRHLGAVHDLRPEWIAVDYMEVYGTDNPTFVTPVTELGSDRHLEAIGDLGPNEGLAPPVDDGGRTSDSMDLGDEPAIP